MQLYLISLLNKTKRKYQLPRKNHISETNIFSTKFRMIIENLLILTRKIVLNEKGDIQKFSKIAIMVKHRKSLIIVSELMPFQKS